MRKSIGLLVLLLVVGLVGCAKPAAGQEPTKDDVNGRKAGERLVKTVEGVEFAFRWCPPGTFTMGKPESEEGRWDETQHEVTLTKGFWMLETEVTQAMWQSVMGESIQQKAGQGTWSHALKGEGANYPMYYVNGDDCQAFCRRLSEKIGMNITQPTEAQWEYACRAGTTGAYAGNGLDAMGWYADNAGNGTHPVGQKQANAWGLYDMHGNVWERCRDWYDDYPSGAVTDPAGPSDSDAKRVLRGGGWDGNANCCRSARRGGTYDGNRHFNVGFRVIALD